MNDKYTVILIGKTLVFLYHKDMHYLCSFFQDKFTKPEEILRYCAEHDIHVHLKPPSCWFNIPEVFDYMTTKILMRHCKNTFFTIEELSGLIESLKAEE